MFENTCSNLEKLSKGAFLVTGDENANVMTIGWGFVGYMWKKKVFIAPVRTSRYSHDILEETGTFTVSFPKDGEMRDALKFTGTKSGRDVDKFKELGLEKVRADKVDTYYVGGCEDHYECKVVGKLNLDTDLLDNEAYEWYKDGDVHTLYFGEILD